MIKRCKGCGISLQNEFINELGYVDDLNKDLCERCFKLSNYGQFKEVSLTNNDYLKVINSIKKDNLVLYIADILSLNLNYINNFHNVILVITKRDILPKSIKDDKITEYLQKQYKNIIDIIIISSINNYNLDNLYNIMQKYNNNKEIYIIGFTNSGKSTLINKLIKNYTNENYKITTSMYPSTTLDKIEINLNNLKIIDTPGLIDNNSIINNLTKQELKKITPKKEIKPKTCQIKKIGSIIVDKYLRIDYETQIPNSLVFYMPNSLNIRFNSLTNDKFKNFPQKKINLEANKDIVIPGLGFIKFTKPIKLIIYIDEKISITIRNNLI